MLNLNGSQLAGQGRQVVVVGAGPGGLACSMQLAQAGFSVTIVERQPYVGGRTSAIRKQGFTIDRGPTFFLYPRILDEIFASVGRDLFKEVPMKRLDPQYHLVFGGGGSILASPDIQQMEQQIAAINPGDAPGFKRFLDENRAKLAGFAPILESPFSSWKQMLNPSLLGLLPLLRPTKSVEQDLGRYFQDPRVRLAFSFQSKYLGMSPFQCPSLFTILSFLEYEYGVFHPYGGCAAVSEKMANICREMGVQIKLGEEVQGLEFRGRRPVAVNTTERQYPCDAMVVNADFSRFMLRYVPNRSRKTWTDQKISKTKFSCSTFMLYLGVRGSLPLQHHTIYFSKNYKGNLDDITFNYRLSQDPSIYIQNPSITDPSLAPEGCSVVYILIPVPHQHATLDWKTLAPQARALAFRQLAALGITDLEERIVFEECYTPNDWDSMEIHRGATFSMAHSLDQMLFLRPQNRYTDLDRVYLVGGSTHPGSGLPVIYNSARITAGLLCEDFGVSQPTAPVCNESVSVS